ncbi:MAG TPA: neutral zinc metallopeptidase [Pilimelia sp.]|nr:neutral zinc metallopeptidase [Pilimelia sp.]
MRAFRLTRLVAVAAVAAVVGTGCMFGTAGTQDGSTGPGGFGRGGDAPSRAEANKTVQAALKDVERYWTATFPKLSGNERFQPVQGGYHPYTRSDPPPACGGEQGQYQPNAFYCPVGDFIAWDAETLIPELNADFGPLLVAVVMAHEYGHAVQARLSRARQPTIVLEQQADCYAGGWIGDVLAGNSAAFDDVPPDQLDSTVGGMLMLRDQPGTSAQAPQAHGNAFDRVRAFQEGVEQGAARCATYRAENLPVTEVPFTTAEEAATGGDLPYDEAVKVLTEDAQAYWTRTFPTLAGRQWEPLRVTAFDPAEPPECAGRELPEDEAQGAAFYCATGDFVAFDGRRLGPTLYRRIGDNAVGMLLADLFAQAAQDRRGESADGRAGQLAVDCLAGSWAFDLLQREPGQGIRLSPGDLDEAVAALLAFGRATDAADASAFDRIAAFRNGVLTGISACD